MKKIILKYFNKLSTLAVIIILVPLELYSQNNEILIDKSYNNSNIFDFFNRTEKKSNAKFFYLKDSLPNINISVYENNMSLNDVLKRNLAKYGYNIKIDMYNNVFISKDKILNFDPTEFFINRQNIKTANTNDLKKNNEYFIEENNEYFIKKVTIGSNSKYKPNKLCEIKGYISDADKGLPLIGAIILIKNPETITTTNSVGYFKLKLKRGSYNIIVSSIGFEDQEYKLNVLSDGNIELSIEKKLYSLDEVIIYTDEDNNVTNNKIGFEKLSIDKIKEIPSLLGEKDIIKAALLLPGIQNVGEGTSGFNVRGSPSDQNMFYLSNIPIYNTSHFFGFFSAFNSDAIKNFKIYKSVLPGKYGGKLASVFEINPKTGNRKKFSSRGGISPITGKILLEGPINENSSYLIALRSTYSNWILNFINYQNISKSKVRFADGIFNFSFFLNKKNRLKLLSYLSYDNINMYPDIKYNYNNTGGELLWNHFFDKNNYMNLSIITSNYGYEETNNEQASTSYIYDYQIHHNEIKADFFINPAYNHKLSYGINSVLYKLNRGNFLPANDSSVITPTNMNTEYASETGVYISEQWDITSILNLSGSFRYNFYSLLGPTEVNSYGDNIIREENNIIETLSFQTGKFIKPNHNPDFRFAFSYIYTPNHSVKLGYNRSHQYIFMLNNTIAISPSDSWKLADYNINPMSINQYSMGFFSNIFKNKFKTSIEFYYKDVKDLVEFKDGAELLPPDLPETKILQGDLNAYGVEFMIKKPQGRLNGWLNYTYSRTSVTVDDPIKELQINFGKAYPSNYDIPHAFNFVLNYKFSRRFSVSVNTVYSTGRPITYPSAVFYVNDLQLLYYSSRNEQRLPDYFRIDLSLLIEGNLLFNKLAHSSWAVSVYNLTGRNNAYSVFFRQGKKNIQAYKLSIFGSPIVSVTYNFKLGNYTN
ncbi:MAG: TonB-dependent receptor [Bacteroidales bacterium]|nr:TonB-dependent receptor [Bacteroidales bacterium]